MKKLTMRGIYEIKDLVNIEEKAKTLDWDGDDGLFNMWDHYLKNPTWEELDTVCHAAGVAVDWGCFKVDHPDKEFSGEADNISLGTTAEEVDHNEEDVIDIA